jgi:hypothetical protein
VSSEQLIAQMQWALAHYDFEREAILELDIYNSGSFLNDLEIPREAGTEILRRASQVPSLKVVLIESRPEHITVDRLAPLCRLFSCGSALETAIGLDAYDDELRIKVLRKGFRRGSFERAVRRAADSGAHLLVYVMLKPWTMSDENALEDAVRAAEYTYTLGARYRIPARVALEPTFVVQGTPLATEYQKRRYHPPSAWLVREAVERIARLGPLVVGLWDEGLRPLAVPTACAKCRSRLLSALRRFNHTQDTSCLRAVRCDCRAEGQLRETR